MTQALIFTGALAVMLGGVWLFGLLLTGSTRQASQFFGAWWRTVKWLAVVGAAAGLIMLQIIPPPD